MLHTSTHTPESAVYPTVQASISMPRLLLHLEGLAVAASALAVYAQQGWHWGAFFALLFVPDLAVLAYLAGPAIGACAYNTLHVYALPLALGVTGLLTDTSVTVQLAVIWGAHIGMDRALGYGLKYATGFKVTHLTRV